jgi:hypothetical protein
MQLAVKLMLVATLGLALPTAAQAGSRTLETTRSSVESHCGGSLQSNGGVIGCTIPCPAGINGKTCDYSCGGPEGAGCRIIVMSRIADLPRIRGGNTQKPKTGTR